MKELAEPRDSAAEACNLDFQMSVEKRGLKGQQFTEPSCCAKCIQSQASNSLKPYGKAKEQWAEAAKNRKCWTDKDSIIEFLTQVT